MLLSFFLITSNVALSSLASLTAKLSVPEFNLQVVHRTFEHPATYQTDPYTGENVTITAAYQDTITYAVVRIKNQAFSPYHSNGQLIELYYYVQSKGHFSNNWISDNQFDERVKQSESDYTTIEYDVNNTSPDAQVDYRVAAVTGYIYELDTHANLNRYVDAFATVDSSNWSNTQTIAINYNYSSTTTSPPPSPTTTAPSY